VSDVIQVKKRNETGTLRMRRMRKAGRIPAVVYGHGKETTAISIASRDVEKLMESGRHIVELGGDISEDALVKEVQWDALGAEVLHLDLARIDASEAVEVNLVVELRGVAPGTRAGGVLNQVLHEIPVRCPANKMPEHLEVNINELELNGVITAGEIEIPQAAELLCDPGDVVVSCLQPVVVEEPEEGVVEGVSEPEVIGRESDEEEGAGEGS
jgi:large subunit ribosomal protein L25